MPRKDILFLGDLKGPEAILPPSLCENGTGEAGALAAIKAIASTSGQMATARATESKAVENNGGEDEL